MSAQSTHSEVIPNEKEQYFLLLTNIEDSSLEYLSDTLETYCGIVTDDLHPKSDCFYKQFLHPEDYEKYLDHLDSFRNKKTAKIKETRARVKNKNGSWDWFEFSSRFYTGDPVKKDKVILSLVSKVLESNPGLNPSPRYFSSEGDYRNLIESLDEAFCVIEMIFDRENKPVDYMFMETNPAFEEQVNLQNVIGKTMKELVPAHEDHWFEVYGKVALTGEPIRFQYCAEKIDNTWFDVYAFRAENCQKVVLLFRNITEAKLAEENLKKAKAELEKKAVERQEKLRQSEELLQTIFDTSNQGIAVFKPLYNKDGNIRDFKFIKINEVLGKMYKDSVPLNRTYLQVSKYGQKIGVFDALKKVVKTGELLDKEYYFNRDGYDHWFRVTGRTQNELLIATIEDITKKKREAQELEETVRFKKQLVQTSPETIMIVNLNSFSVRYINKDIFTEEGITRKKVEDMPLQDILPYVHPRDREIVMDMHRNLLKSSEDDILDIEVRLKINGVSWEWFSVRGKVFQRKDENWVDEYVLLVRNIHKQKATQEALLNAEKFSIQGELARMLAHELRNPIASIGMATEVLGHKVGSPQKEELKNYFQILGRSAKTLDKLVNNLLNSANYSPCVLKEEDLASIIESSIEKASDRIYLSGLKINKNYQKGSYPVMADKEKLEIAIVNILVNASEAVVPNEGIIEIGIESHKTGFQLSIKDNGHGLESDQIDKLFDAFYTNKESGTGIGLNSVKNIMQEHDAKIEVCSKPDQGTTFRMYFHKI